jgi:hypothetical protein
MARKPRIVITVVTDDSTIEFSTVKGREMADGTPSPGPTETQLAIVRRAIRDLVLDGAANLTKESA